MTYDLLAEITQDTQLKRTSSSRGGQYNGPCPWCGGTRSLPGAAALRQVWIFRVQPVQALGHCHRLPDAQARLFQAACSCNGRMGAAGWQAPLGEYSSLSTTEPPWLGGTAGAVATRCDCLLPGMPARPVVGSW